MPKVKATPGLKVKSSRPARNVLPPHRFRDDDDISDVPANSPDAIHDVTSPSTDTTAAILSELRALKKHVNLLTRQPSPNPEVVEGRRRFAEFLRKLLVYIEH